MVVRNRLHLQETVQETPESSVASGTSTPTLDGHVTPAGTILTDDNVSDTEFVIVRDTEDHLQPAMPGYQVGNSMARPSVDNSGGGVNKQSSAGQSEHTSGFMLVRNMREYIMLGMLVLLVSFATMPLWNRWVGQGNVISLSIRVGPGHGGNEAMPTHTTSIINTVTETIHVSTVETRYRTVTSTQVSTETTTCVRILTRTVTATSTMTTAVTATKPGTASSKPKPTNKAGSYSEATLRRWEGGSSPTTQCYHGNAPTRYYSFLSRRKKLQRQEALWGCLDNSKNGIRWKGVNCGGARWEVEVDPNDGAVYSDSKKCWQRCEKCLSGAIKKVLEEAECVVEDRGSRCVARYTEL